MFAPIIGCLESLALLLTMTFNTETVSMLFASMTALLP